MTYSRIRRYLLRVDRKFRNGPGDKHNRRPVRTPVDYVVLVSYNKVYQTTERGRFLVLYFFFFMGSEAFIYRVAYLYSLTLSTLVVFCITLQQLSEYCCYCVFPYLCEKQIIIIGAIIGCIWNSYTRDLASSREHVVSGVFGFNEAPFRSRPCVKLQTFLP